MTARRDPSALLGQRRMEVRARMADLRRDVESIVASARMSNGDDEHDPEGATIAFEREQLNALLSGARAQLAEIDDAIARIEGGYYGRCVDCGADIGDERLAARPSAARCMRCAQ